MDSVQEKTLEQKTKEQPLPEVPLKESKAPKHYKIIPNLDSLLSEAAQIKA